jgi:hypothetical protein
MAVGMLKDGINGVIVENPDQALAMAGALLALGSGLTLRRIWHSVAGRDLAVIEAAEVDLLDEAAPPAFWHDAVGAVADSIDTAGPRARVRWGLGRFAFARPVLGGLGARSIDTATTAIETPMLDTETGRLVDDPAVLARVLALRGGQPPVL